MVSKTKTTKLIECPVCKVKKRYKFNKLCLALNRCKYCKVDLIFNKFGKLVDNA